MDFQQEPMAIDAEQLSDAIKNVKAEIGKVIVGQENMVELLLAAVLADGHVCIEGVPVLPKH